MSMSISISPIGSRVSKWGEGPIFWDDHLLYVDIEGHPETSAMKHALKELEFYCGEKKVKILGTYLASPLRKSSIIK